MIENPPVASRNMLIFWYAAQALGLVVTIGLLFGLVLAPAPSLNVLWNILIPILPATFLVAPALWRGVCPLATLNVLSSGRAAKKRPLSLRALPVVGAAGIFLLLILVPARRFMFNEDGMMLAIVVAVVALAALGSGLFFDLKGGFCNSVCPVLPVEKLYGQRPMLEVANPRCSPCTVCTPRGCLDLAPTKAAARAAGNGKGAWLRTSYGLFAAAFPGFVIGYFNTENVPLREAGAVYLEIGLWSIGSLALFGAIGLLFRVRAATILPWLGVLALGLYYWFAAPSMAEGVGLGPTAAVMIRASAGVLIGVWIRRNAASLRLRTREVPRPASS